MLHLALKVSSILIYIYLAFHNIPNDTGVKVPEVAGPGCVSVINNRNVERQNQQTPLLA